MSPHSPPTSTEPIPTGGKPRPSPASRPKKRKWGLLPLLLVVIAIAGSAAGAWYLHHEGNAKASASQTTARASGTAETVTVDVVRPKRGGMERVSTMIGSVHGFESASLLANVSGYLKSQEIEIDGKRVPVDIGVHVKKGDLLAEIDVPEVLAEAEQAEADVKQAEAQAAQAQARIETARADQRAAEAAVKQAEAEVGRYTSKKNETWKAFQRYKGLRGLSAVEQDVVDQKEEAYESSVSAENAARAQVVASQAQAVAAKAKVAQAESDLNAAQASVSVARAKLKKAQAFVSYTKIRSPYTGVITHREYFVGDFIRSAAEGNTKPMLTVARTDKMRIVTKVPDKDVPYADVGDPAVVTIDALPGVKLTGTVSRFSEAEDPTDRMMRTEIDLPNDESSPSHGRLRDGMYGYATIILEPPTQNLTIPSSCLTGATENGESHILVARGDVARDLPVHIGRDNGVEVEILSGLAPDDLVIVPNGSVSDGTPVAPVNTDAKAQTAEASH